MIGKTYWPSKDMFEFSGFEHPLVPSKPPGFHDKTRLYGQALTAFCTTRVNNFTTCFCAHTRTETVGTNAFQVTWLKCSFHDVKPLKIYLLPGCPIQPNKSEKGPQQYCLNGHMSTKNAGNGLIHSILTSLWITFDFRYRLGTRFVLYRLST